ncbi:hypothetical protein Dimus_030911, partial [Dionaea muscipula]
KSRTDEATEDVAKDEVSPPKQKRRNMTKGGEAVVARGSEETTVTEKGKEVVVEPVKVDEANLTIAPQLVPDVVTQQQPEAGRKTKGKGKKTGDGKSGQGKLLPSLLLPPSVLLIDPSSPSPTTSQPLAYATTKWTLMPHHNVLSRAPDKAA